MSASTAAASTRVHIALTMQLTKQAEYIHITTKTLAEPLDLFRLNRRHIPMQVAPIEAAEGVALIITPVISAHASLSL